MAPLVRPVRRRRCDKYIVTDPAVHALSIQTATQAGCVNRRNNAGATVTEACTPESSRSGLTEGADYQGIEDSSVARGRGVIARWGVPPGGWRRF